MDVPLVIRRRLNELGLEQKDLAVAAQVTESYISQLLARKKAPPAPNRTDIYDKIGKFLKLPGGELSKLASLQRREELKKKIADPPSPLFKDFREFCSNGLLTLDCFPPEIAQAQSRGETGVETAHRLIADRPCMGELQRRYLELILAETGWNRRKAAAVLNLDRRTIQRLIARYRLGAFTPEAEPDQGQAQEALA